MFTFRRFCFVLSRQRCIDSGNEEAEPHSDAVSASDSKIGFVGKYSELEEPTAGSYLKLTLTVVETTAMTMGEIFEITPKGLKNSPRKITGGKTYAGSGTPEGEIILNDIVLPGSERGVGKQHFVIEYNLQARNYRLRDLSEGTGTFIKLDQPLLLSKLSIISFGESHLTLSLEGPSDSPDLKVTIIEGPRKDDKMYVPGSLFTKRDSPVRMGRVQDCSLWIDDPNLSRCQCVAEFDNRGWVIRDGDGKKPSTNGTWYLLPRLFADDDCEIFDNMIFKAGQTLFSVLTM